MNGSQWVRSSHGGLLLSTKETGHVSVLSSIVVDLELLAARAEDGTERCRVMEELVGVTLLMLPHVRGRARDPRAQAR